MTARMINEIFPDVEDFGPIPQKPDEMVGVYMGNDVVMTRMWTSHIIYVSTRDMIVTPHMIRIG